MVDQQLLGLVARQVYKTIRTQQKWEETLLPHFPSLTLFHPKSILDQVLVNLHHNPILSLRFFTWLCSDRTQGGFGYIPDQSSQKSIFHHLLRSNSSTHILSFLHSTSSNFVSDLDLPSINSFLRRLLKDGAIQEALSLIKTTISSSTSSTSSSSPILPLSVWNAALSTSLRLARTDFFWELYSHMTETDDKTAGYLLQAFCLDDKLSEAYDLVRQLLNCGVVPDVSSCNRLISCFARERDYGKVSEVLHLMIANNRTPAISTYQEIIFWLCKNGMGDEAFRIFNDLKDRGYDPDNHMYHTMIKGLSKMGQMEQAKKLCFEMSHKGFNPNISTYNVMIDGYCKNGNLEEARRLFDELESRGICQTTATFNTIIAGMCLGERMDQACSLFDEMVKKKINPDVITYSTLIEGFCKIGKMDKAVDVYHELLSTDLHPSGASCTPLIRALCNMGKVQESIDLWNDMANRGVDLPVRCHDYIIIGFCKQGNAAQGMDWLKVVLESKLRPLEKTFSVVVESLALNNQLDDALVILNYMFEMGYRPGQEVCCYLVQQLCEEEHYQAKKCMEQILERN